MPDLDPRKERTKKRVRIGAFIAASSTVITTALLQPGPQWVLLAVGVAAAIAVAASADLPRGRGRDGRAEAQSLPMMPDIDPREVRRKKRGRVSAFIGSCTMAISALFQPGWEWLPLAVGVSAAIAVAASADLPGGSGRDGGLTGRALILLIRDRTVTGSRGSGSGSGSGSGLTGPGRDDDDGPVDATAHQWRMLAAVSRLMPRPAGRRWLAEAESLLSEILPVRRGAAIRSYLLSAPLLVVMMWAREAQRRARLGPRRPG
jgi:hypothetical protein